MGDGMKRIHWRLVAAALLLAVAPLTAGCAASEAEGADRLTVAVSIVPEEAFVRAVCGELADIVTIIPPGYSPENYEPSPAEMVRVSRAAVYFTIGVPAESAGILPDLPDSVRVVSLSEAAADVYPERAFESGGRDPHVWLSPKRVRVMTDTIAAVLGEVDPDNAALYRSNADAFMEELDALDREIAGYFEGIADPIFVVSHPAYGYLADDYGLRMESLEQDGKEATPRHMEWLIELARECGIRAIFTQAECDASLPDVFAREIGGEKIVLSPLSADYLNNMRLMARAIADGCGAGTHGEAGQ